MIRHTRLSTYSLWSLDILGHDQRHMADECGRSGPAGYRNTVASGQSQAAVAPPRHPHIDYIHDFARSSVHNCHHSDRCQAHELEAAAAACQSQNLDIQEAEVAT
jgi:hypothetical protein